MMESQRPTQPDPGLCGCDRDVFLRVWQRVMPEERPDCPITVEHPQHFPVPAAPENMRLAVEGAGDDFPTPDDVPCLGSNAHAHGDRLQEFITRELARSRSYQLLARRSGQGGRVLSAMAACCRKRAKRLSAALFLISAVRFWPAEQPTVNMPRSYLGALRELFLSEQNQGGDYRAAAEDCRDICLRTLYLDLAEECADHACRIRVLLENL